MARPPEQSECDRLPSLDQFLQHYSIADHITKIVAAGFDTVAAWMGQPIQKLDRMLASAGVQEMFRDDIIRDLCIPEWWTVIPFAAHAPVPMSDS